MCTEVVHRGNLSEGSGVPHSAFQMVLAGGMRSLSAAYNPLPLPTALLCFAADVRFDRLLEQFPSLYKASTSAGCTACLLQACQRRYVEQPAQHSIVMARQTAKSGTNALCHRGHRLLPCHRLRQSAMPTWCALTSPSCRTPTLMTSSTMRSGCSRWHGEWGRELQPRRPAPPGAVMFVASCHNMYMGVAG